MLYRTILTINGEYKKTMHRCKTRETAFINFNRIKEENVVDFPKRFVNCNGIIPAKYKIYVVKDFEEEDERRYIRDEMGRVKLEDPIFGIWTVLNDADYDVEETFWVYGYNNIHDRKTIRDIIKILMKGITDKSNIKQVIVVHNKVLVYNEEQFDMVVCKCKDDAQRLHHTLYETFKDYKFKNLLFMGTAKNLMISEYYDIIHDNTKWPYTKIRRTTTRP